MSWEWSNEVYYYDFILFCILGSSNTFCIFYALLRYASLEEENYWVGLCANQLQNDSLGLHSLIGLKNLIQPAASVQLPCKTDDSAEVNCVLFWILVSWEQLPVWHQSAVANYIKQPKQISASELVSICAVSIFSSVFETSFRIHDETLDMGQGTISTS